MSAPNGFGLFLKTQRYHAVRYTLQKSYKFEDEGFSVYDVYQDDIADDLRVESALPEFHLRGINCCQI